MGLTVNRWRAKCRRDGQASIVVVIERNWFELEIRLPPDCRIRMNEWLFHAHPDMGRPSRMEADRAELPLAAR